MQELPHGQRIRKCVGHLRFTIYGLGNSRPCARKRSMAVSQFSPLRGSTCRPPRASGALILQIVRRTSYIGEAAAASAMQFPPLCNDLRAWFSKFSLASAQLPRAAGALILQIVHRTSYIGEAAAASAMQFPPLCNGLRAWFSRFSLAPAQLPRASGVLTLQIVNRK